MKSISDLPGVRSGTASPWWHAFITCAASVVMVFFAVAVYAADAVSSGDSGNAPASGDTRVIDPIAKDALSVRRAISQGDYATARQITAEVFAQSRIENWRYYPASDFMGEIALVRGAQFGRHLDEWVAQDKDAPIPLLLRAQYYYDEGWSTRGDNFSSDTQTNRLTVFTEYMAKALADVDAAIRLDASNPYAFHLKLRIVQSYGNLPATRAAFASAQTRFPAYYPLYDVMLMALQPKWGGTIAAMYAFVDKQAGDAPQFSPLKLLYLDLYGRLLDSAAISCRSYYTDRDKRHQCVTGVMAELAKPELETEVSSALQLYDHTDHYEFGLAVRSVLFTMLGVAGGQDYAGAILQQAATSMHSDTQLKHQGPEHNDYVVDELIAASWNTQEFFDNALTKYQQALVDAQAGEFPSPTEKDLAIGYIYEQLAEISGNRLQLYDDLIRHEQSAVAHGMVWDEHYICYGYYKLRHYDQAIQACTAAIRDTDNAVAQYWRGMAYRDSGNTDAALNDFAAEADSEGFFAALSAIAMSMIYFDRNDNQGALDILNKYTFLYDVHRTAASDVAVAYNNRCYAYMQLGKWEQALGDCTASLRHGTIPDAYRKQQELIKRLGQ
jgi:tetratricopeptide (TPR) repeat protein